jgi:sarcosine oxidase/L-pipecolate oxidase
MSKPSQKSYIIVGSGVFGASTAYHLSNAHPEASITLIDRELPFPSRQGASNDENKIIRADYDSLFYCELALEAKKMWENDLLFKTFYHQPGMINTRKLGRMIIENYETLGVNHRCEIIDSEELAKRYGGLFAGVDYSNVDEIFVNPQSGWAEATKAARNVVEAAMTNGVQCVEGNVLRLVFDKNGTCTGVQLNSGPPHAPVDGRILSADRVIVCTGAGTAKLFADSAPDRAELQVEDRITAAAVVTGFIQLTPTQIERFKNCPIFVHDGDNVKGMDSPNSENRR